MSVFTNYTYGGSIVLRSSILACVDRVNQTQRRASKEGRMWSLELQVYVGDGVPWPSIVSHRIGTGDEEAAVRWVDRARR